ncbi:MAG: hypothetical protein VB860_10355 [Dehalococcoidia bacterium]
MIDTRKSEPELYVADRANARIVGLDLEGEFKRVINSGILSTPCPFATDGEVLAVAELRARMSLLDSEDRLIGYLGGRSSLRQARMAERAGRKRIASTPFGR